MRKITFWLLCAVVFSVPWEESVTLFNVASITHVLGILAVAMGGLATVTSGRFRRPGVVLSFALAFTLMSMLSLVWSVSPDTSGRVVTYGQLLALVWLVSEFASTPERQQLLMMAYCLGAFVSIADLIRNFISGEQYENLRFSGGALNPNDLGLTLSIAIPMAWQLFLTRKGIVRFIAAVYVPLALVAILLTASRSALPAAVAALIIIPLTLARQSGRSMVSTTALLVGAIVLASVLVPEYSWDRIATFRQEALRGTLSGRTEIWRAGLQVFQQRPVLGVGAGGFESAVEPLLGRQYAHNLFIAILVEQGVVGLTVFGALIGACAWRVYRLPNFDRKLWAVVAMTWLVGAMSNGWQYRKTTWLLVGLIAANPVLAAIRRRAVNRDEAIVSMPVLPSERTGPMPFIPVTQSESSGRSSSC